MSTIVAPLHLVVRKMWNQNILQLFQVRQIQYFVDLAAGAHIQFTESDWGKKVEVPIHGKSLFFWVSELLPQKNPGGNQSSFCLRENEEEIELYCICYCRSHFFGVRISFSLRQYKFGLTPLKSVEAH